MNTPPNPEDDNNPGVESELRTLTEEEARALDRGRLTEKVKKILGDADTRDDQATALDDVADERALVSDRDAFTGPDAVYAGPGKRRAAALDRRDSKTDRESSAEDRTHLTDNEADDKGLTTKETQTLKHKINELVKDRDANQRPTPD
ncbi:hypothetical protein AX769_21290 (plasmid) [Frondihabitans sp. PAMC 28766]|uniref:hypothetical protein n=1 Tax=Frondihabitans sp. PAMC 28766 TaxID=1795630 RepID=UPI00078CD1D1|nr:hypothetical protein [Frondihabitans sp. PAMC 28766]AMM22671.1 hypothetical protein AX769_21290 [Frondihabitans sp. PAMC 28766]